MISYYPRKNISMLFMVEYQKRLMGSFDLPQLIELTLGRCWLDFKFWVGECPIIIPETLYGPTITFVQQLLPMAHTIAEKRRISLPVKLGIDLGKTIGKTIYWCQVGMEGEYNSTRESQIWEEYSRYRKVTLGTDPHDGNIWFFDKPEAPFHRLSTLADFRPFDYVPYSRNPNGT